MSLHLLVRSKLACWGRRRRTNFITTATTWSFFPSSIKIYRRGYRRVVLSFYAQMKMMMSQWLLFHTTAFFGSNIITIIIKHGHEMRRATPVKFTPAYNSGAWIAMVFPQGSAFNCASFILREKVPVRRSNILFRTKYLPFFHKHSKPLISHFIK